MCLIRTIYHRLYFYSLVKVRSILSFSMNLYLMYMPCSVSASSSFFFFLVRTFSTKHMDDFVFSLQYFSLKHKLSHFTLYSEITVLARNCTVYICIIIPAIYLFNHCYPYAHIKIIRKTSLQQQERRRNVKPEKRQVAREDVGTVRKNESISSLYALRQHCLSLLPHFHCLLQGNFGNFPYPWKGLADQLQVPRLTG